MKRFIISVTSFCLLTLIISFLADDVVSAGLQKTHYYEFTEWNEIIHGEVQADVLITGSSRAHFQVDPRIIDSAFHCNSYNLGLDGHNFYLQDARLHTYLKYNRKPKAIIQILDLFTLEKRADLFRYEQFLPYFSESTITSSIKTYKGFDWIDYRIPFLRYRHKPELISIGLNEFFNIKHPVSDKKYKGYEAMDLSWDSSFNNFVKKYPSGVRLKLHEPSVHLFESFLRESQAEKIKVFLVYAPEYKAVQPYFVNRDSVITLYRTLAKKHDVPFIDYSRHAISSNKNLFYNSEHLNKTGSRKFCLALSADLEKLLSPALP